MKNISTCLPLKLFAAGAMALALAACSLPNNTATKAAAKASGSFSDGEILQVLRNLNEAEIAQAELVMQNTQSEQLRNTAERIIEDHSRNNQRIDAMAQSGIELEKSPLSRGLKTQTDAIEEELSELTGTEFECAFLEKQIEQHELALETVRAELQPDAQNPQLRRLLSSTAPALRHHLESAQETRDNMTQCATS